MKRVIILSILAIFVSVSAASAQEKGYTAVFSLREEAFNMNGHNNFFSTNFSLAPGYAFNSRLFLRAQLDVVIAMWDGAGSISNRSGSGTYTTNVTLGPAFGVNVMKDKGHGILDVTGSVGHSLLVKRWRYVYYDLGVNWAIPVSSNPRKFEFRPYFGVGVRYNDSYRSTMSDLCNFYVQVGFRFN